MRAVLESSYELLFAQQMDDRGVRWEKCRGVRFEYTAADGRRRGYLPDFFLPDHHVYVDVKNDYLIKRDQFKIDAVRKEHPIDLRICSLQDITSFEFVGSLPAVAQGEQGAL